MVKVKAILVAVLLMVTVIIATGCNSTGAKMATIETVDITAEQALQMWQNKTAIIIDVRTPTEYQEGHIPDVANIPLDQITNRMSEIPKDKNVLLICRSGKRSGQGTSLLRNNGFNNVHNITEGMNGWTGPVVK